MDSHNETAQEIVSKQSSSSMNLMLQAAGGSLVGGAGTSQGATTEEDRRFFQGVLGQNDNESETNTSSMQKGGAISFTKNSASSKQIIMSMSATSENVVADKEQDHSSHQLPISQAAVNGVDNPAIYANYTATMNDSNEHQYHHIQQYSSQHCFDNTQISSQGQERYHNRHATHHYGGSANASTIHPSQQHTATLGTGNFREQSSSSVTNLIPKQNPNMTTSILVNAGQYASQAVSNNQHHIPIRNATGQLLMQAPPQTTFGAASILINRGSSQQSNHHPQQQSTQHTPATSTLSQQQIQQQQYKTAKTQMYEKMLIQQQSIIDKKPLIYTQSGATNFNQTQMAAASALNHQHQFLSNQGFSLQQQQQQSLIFPRIANIRNENAGPIYKTASQQPISQQVIAATSAAQIGSFQMIQQQQQLTNNIQSPFTQTHKQNQGVSTPGQGNALSIMANNNFAAKKKTVSPRNVTNPQVLGVHTQGSTLGAPKMLLMADKNQQMIDFAQGKSLAPQTIGLVADEHKNSIIEQANGQSENKNRNRLKSNHYNITTNDFTDTPSAQLKMIGNNGGNYNTEKLTAAGGHQIMITSESQSALGGKIDEPKLLPLNGQAANQFFCGEMNINTDNQRRQVIEEPSSMYHQQAVTPSIMSSHSNKRQSHHIQVYNPALIQNIQGSSSIGNESSLQAQQQLQQPPQMSHNFFSRRTVSQKDSNGHIGFKMPLNASSTNANQLQQHMFTNQQHQQETQQQQQPGYPFSPQGGIVGNQNSQLRSGMASDINDPQRTKYAQNMVGTRSSQEGSPSKSVMHQQLAVTSPSTTVTTTTEASQLQPSDSNQVATMVVGPDGQQAVKIPVICGFHKRVLLLTSQIQNQAGQINVNGLPIAGAPTQQQRDSLNKKVRNRNPNCNHNNNSVFYAPCYNNVKYDDSYKKKEEVLRKVFFKECAREDDKRISQQQYYPPGAQPAAPNKNDPFTYLKPIENFLISTLFIDYDIQQANKQNPGNFPLRQPVPTSNLFMELGLEQAIVAHKAFLLALIQSGKITNENMLKVLHEFKSSAQEFDHECIYCKYSQYALRESTKVIKNSLKVVAADPSNPEYEAANRQLLLIGQPLAQQMQEQLLQDPRIEYLIRMFQSQLFKRSFINTSLMIIQRKMNEKLLQKQRLPPGLGGQPNGQPQGQLLDANGKPKKPLKLDGSKKPNGPPVSSLEWIGQQMQKLGKNLSNPKEKDKYLELREKYYREFLMQINRSNNVLIPFPKQTFTPYKYYIGKGNNSILVRNCLKQRFWWSMGDFEDWDEYNFIWTQWKANKIVAKIKTNQEVLALTAETNGKTPGVATSESMLSTDRDSNSSAETLLATPTKRKRVATALLTSSQNVAAVNNLAIKKNTSASKTNVLSKPGVAGAVVQPPVEAEPKKETSHHMITYSHMENNYHLSNKKALYYNMKIYYESTGQDWFNVLPLTFHIKEGASDKEYVRFTELFKDYDSGKNQGAYEKLGKQIWIVKPGENTNRGCGIQVCRELSQIKEIISNTNFNGQKRSYIIQKYIERPLLYKNRKFDIRCYTLMTTVNGNLQGYWYNEGYLRTSSKDFNLKNVTNRLIHLTNDAVQKKSDDYGKFESGNKLSYPDFQKYMDSVDIKCNFVKEIVPQLKKMAADTIKACSRKVDPHRRHNTFEIFGYDFMIDEDLQPWLIEVNTNPCLELSAPYLSRLIPTMIENAVKIAVDPLFPPPPWPNAKKHTIPDCMENNRFELVFNELTDAAELKNLPIDDGAMNGIIEEEEMEDEGSDNDGDEEEIA